MMDYTVSRSFPFLNFPLYQARNLTSWDQFLSFTDNFMVVSFEDIISKSPFDIMKLAYRDLKLRNVLRVFIFVICYKKTIFCLSLNSLNIMLEIILRLS